MSLSDVAGRATGQFPISIATSLAIEGALGIYENRLVEPPPILSYDEIWINLRTLHRNFIGSLEKGVVESITVETCVSALNEEMDTIHSIIKERAGDRTNVIYYVSNYADIDKKYPHAVTRRDNTVKQKMYTGLMNDTIAALIKTHPPGNIQIFKLKLHPEKKTKALILTNYAYDLVSYKEFKELTLLESHSGVLKPRELWWTKFYEHKDLARIPFTEGFLQVMGDANSFRPFDIKVRKQILELAEQYKWTAVTTSDKFRYSINQLKDHYTKAVLLEILT